MPSFMTKISEYITTSSPSTLLLLVVEGVNDLLIVGSMEHVVIIKQLHSFHDVLVGLGLVKYDRYNRSDVLFIPDALLKVCSLRDIRDGLSKVLYILAENLELIDIFLSFRSGYKPMVLPLEAECEY